MHAYRVCMIKKQPDVLLKNVTAYFQLLRLEETLLDHSNPSGLLFLTTMNREFSACPAWQVQSAFQSNTRHFLQSHWPFTQTKFPGVLWQSPPKGYSISCLAFLMLCNLNPLLKKALTVALATSRCGMQDQMNHTSHARWQGSSVFPSTSVLKFPTFSGSILEKNGIKLDQTSPCSYCFAP